MKQIERLRSKIVELECRKLFGRRSYPNGIVEFPYPLTGRGFFPGGDGLWRERDAIARPAVAAFPYDGVLLLGQDFGSLSRYPPPERAYESASNPTWRYLESRLMLSGIPPARIFFSNGLLGLRESGSCDGRNPGMENPRFVRMCREFLEFQVETQNPRLVIVFNSLDDAVIRPLCMGGIRDRRDVGIEEVEIVGRRRILLRTKHPRSDCGVIGKNEPNYSARWKALKLAWLCAAGEAGIEV